MSDHQIGGEANPELPPSRFVQQPDPAERQWLLLQLQPNEQLLAWLGVSTVWVAPGTELPGAKHSWRYLLTTERSALVAFAAKGGPITELELPRQALEVTDTLGRDLVVVGQQRFKTQLNNDTLFQQVAAAGALEREDRLQLVARFNWTYPDAAGAHPREALRLLCLLASDTDAPLARVAAITLAAALQPSTQQEPLEAESQRQELAPHLARMLDYPQAPEALAAWAAEFRLAPALQRGLVRACLELTPPQPAAALALPLHRQLRQAVQAEEQDPLRLSIMDAVFGKHLLQADQHDEARQLLEHRLEHLPDETLADLLPAPGADLTAGGGQQLRCALLELLVQARGEPDAPDVESVAALALLQPLVPARLAALLEVAAGEQQQRAEALERALGRGGLEPATPRDPPAELHPLPAAEVESALVHPAAREGGALDWLKVRLGKAAVPDYSAIRAYSERVTERHPELLAAATDAAMALGVEAVEAYISRGEKGVGVRAFEGQPPFLLVGGQHLEPESELHMGPAELRFAVAAEVAHLRHGHTRLTSSEVWDGVYHKGATVLDAFTMLAAPLGFLGKAVKGIERLSKVERVLSRTSALGQRTADLFGYARDVKQATSLVAGGGSGGEAAISARDEELLAACRVMQLTADRAALVFGGDLVAGVRALFLLSGSAAQLSMARRHGLAKTLHRRDEQGQLMHQDLAVRVAALCSFYLKPEGFARLRRLLLEGRSEKK